MKKTPQQLIISKHKKNLMWLIDEHLKGEPFDLEISNVTYGDPIPIEDKMLAGKYRVRVTRHSKKMKPKEPVVVATFELRQMINCCGICVSTAAFVHEEWRGFGLGTAMNSLRIDIARAAGYSLLLCTDIVSNEPQMKILASNGWKEIYRFVNQGTGNTIGIHVIPLR